MACLQVGVAYLTIPSRVIPSSRGGAYNEVELLLGTIEYKRGLLRQSFKMFLLFWYPCGGQWVQSVGFFCGGGATRFFVKGRVLTEGEQKTIADLGYVPV